MIWINLTILATGLGIGVASGWLLGRRGKFSIAQPEPTTQPELTTQPKAQFTAEQQTLARLQQTQLAYHQAVEMEKFKSGFLARSSHELRSPINSVISLHQLILSDLCEDPVEEREFIAQAQGAAEKMLALLDRLISLSKISCGLEPLQPQVLHLENVFAEVEHFVQLLAQNRSIRLEITPPDPDLYVLADPRWLRQILISLMDAPILLMQEGYVRLKSQVDLDNQQVQIWVEDQRPIEFWSESIDLLKAVNGEGICSSDGGQEAIDPTPTPGLSLLIIQTLLDAMGGRLEILATPLAALPEPSVEVSEVPELSRREAIDHSPLQLPNLTRIQCSLPWAAKEAEEIL